MWSILQPFIPSFNAIPVSILHDGRLQRWTNLAEKPECLHASSIETISQLSQQDGLGVYTVFFTKGVSLNCHSLTVWSSAFTQVSMPFWRQAICRQFAKEPTSPLFPASRKRHISVIIYRLPFLVCERKESMHLVDQRLWSHMELTNTEMPIKREVNSIDFRWVSCWSV